jgi:hypothetical protein
VRSVPAKCGADGCRGADGRLVPLACSGGTPILFAFCAIPAHAASGGQRQWMSSPRCKRRENITKRPDRTKAVVSCVAGGAKMQSDKTRVVGRRPAARGRGLPRLRHVLVKPEASICFVKKFSWSARICGVDPGCELFKFQMSSNTRRPQ